jgi:hypothetical protein
MRILAILFLALSLVGRGLADDLPPRDEALADPREVAAANAMMSLHREVLQESLTPHLTVGEYVERLGASSALYAAIQDARQLGGPRWIDPETVQVRVELPASRVARFLVESARASGKSGPLSAPQLRDLTRDWDKRVFTATGVGLTPARSHQLEQLLGDSPSPAMIPEWASGWIEASGSAARADSGLEARRQAESAAIEQLRRRMDELALPDGRTIRQFSSDDRWSRELERALVRARVISTRSDEQRVWVDVRLDGKVVWDAVQKCLAGS